MYVKETFFKQKCYMFKQIHKKISKQSAFKMH